MLKLVQYFLCKKGHEFEVVSEIMDLVGAEEALDSFSKHPAYVRVSFSACSTR